MKPFEMRRIAVFGSTGACGRRVVEVALEQGLEVVAYARRPSRLGPLADRVEVVEGELADADRIADALTGVDAVFSLLGPTTLSPGRRPLSDGMCHILDGMQAHGIVRILAIATPSVPAPGDKPHLMLSPIGSFVRTFGSTAFDEFRGMADRLRRSDADWTLVRIPFLTNAPPVDDLDRLRAGLLDRRTGWKLSRNNLARWMVHEAEARDWVRGAPVLSDP